ncbi:MAG: hypothetical protein JSV21_11280, partial [Nitrospirota bacterium]
MMTNTKLLYRLLLLVPVVMFTISVTGNVSAADKKDCLECHGAMTKATIVHKAIDKGCNSCHGNSHAGGSPQLALKGDQPRLCYDCHRSGQFRKKHQHVP